MGKEVIISRRAAFVSDHGGAIWRPEFWRPLFFDLPALSAPSAPVPKLSEGRSSFVSAPSTFCTVSAPLLHYLHYLPPPLWLAAGSSRWLGLGECVVFDPRTMSSMVSSIHVRVKGARPYGSITKVVGDGTVYPECEHFGLTLPLLHHTRFFTPLRWVQNDSERPDWGKFPLDWTRPRLLL